jgi:hypothetical protein
MNILGFSGCKTLKTQEGVIKRLRKVDHLIPSSARVIIATTDDGRFMPVVILPNDELAIARQLIDNNIYVIG